MPENAVGGAKAAPGVRAAVLPRRSQVGPNETSSASNSTYTFVCKPPDVRVSPIIDTLANT